ncbi:MAG TPA: glycosyltransferase family 9 protein [Pyrinomonadaceae bacterium]|nr:glycosyltransferase family 9 protein [Pyrinomonadaceae bacterium]
MQFDPRNILVIHFGQLGDVVMGLPAFRAIRRRFPNARITAAVGKPANEVVAMSGYADEIFEVDRVSLRDGNKLISIGRIIKFVRRVRQAKFDFVIDLHSLSETNLLGYLSGAPHRLYSRRPGRSLDYLANFKPRPPLEDNSRHVTDRYLDVLKSLDIQDPSPVPVIKTSPAVDFAVDALLKKEKAQSGELLVGLFPGAGHVSRKWPLKHYAQLADHLIRNNRVRVVVFAGPEEREMVPHMRAIFPPNTIFLDRLTIPQLVSAQARLTVLISNDTGPAHLAAAVGAPVVVILDRPTPHSFVPRGSHHRLIFGAEITKVPVDEVYKAAYELLALSRTDRLLYSDNSQA